MTLLLFYEDAYVRAFDAAVVAVRQAESGLQVALDRTAFYPGGGGQPADWGWLEFGGIRSAVRTVSREGDLIWHGLDAPSVPGGLPADAVASGQPVRGALDWERRHLLMRTHTAMHILCGVVWRDYGASVTGGNMDPGRGRMDFEFAALTRGLIDEIAQRCAAEIAAGRAVRARILPRSEAFQIPDLIRTKVNLLPPGIEQVRTVEIVGLDLQADGGTHVRNTREVSVMNVVDYKSKGAINKRIYIELA